MKNRYELGDLVKTESTFGVITGVISRARETAYELEEGEKLQVIDEKAIVASFKQVKSAKTETPRKRVPKTMAGVQAEMTESQPTAN